MHVFKIATFFTGSEFTINYLNNSIWESPWRGLELAFDFTRYQTYINLSLGLAVFFLSRILGVLYLMNSVDNNEILDNARIVLIRSAVPFLILFLFFVINIFIMNGFGYDPLSKDVSMIKFKYLNNMIEMPLVGIMFLIGVIAVLLGIVRAYFFFNRHKSSAIWFTGIGTILTVFALLLTVGLNSTSFYPSTFDLQSSLTIENASSSEYTLVAMSYVSLIVPFVFAYIWYAWKSLNKKKITEDEMINDHHAY